MRTGLKKETHIYNIKHTCIAIFYVTPTLSVDGAIAGAGSATGAGSVTAGASSANTRAAVATATKASLRNIVFV